MGSWVAGGKSRKSGMMWGISLGVVMGVPARSATRRMGPTLSGSTKVDMEWTGVSASHKGRETTHPELAKNVAREERRGNCRLVCNCQGRSIKGTEPTPHNESIPSNKPKDPR